MGKHKKKFINKKEAVSFQLIHRSQRDPLQADNEVSERILHPISNLQDRSSELDHGVGQEQRFSEREENAKYGIFFDDDYDYMQHLRERGEGVLVLDNTLPMAQSQETRRGEGFKEFGSGIKLPNEVLASQYEEKEGMLSKGVLPRGPQPDWDPDIVACLDEALDLDDPENILEDDFIMRANAGSEEVYRVEDCDDEESGSEYYDSEDDDSDFSLSSDDDRSQGTRYSMTSSVIRRTQELKILDDRFDKILEEYEDNEIGGLDGEEIGGYVKTDEQLGDRIMDEMLRQCPKTLKELATEEDEDGQRALRGRVVEKESDSEDEQLTRHMDKEKEQWDCESILSTYSTLYNHPKVICEPKGEKTIQLTKRHCIPVGVLKSKNVPDSTNRPDRNEALNNSRNKDESQGDKKLRKQAVKEERRRRRVEKKATKQMFKSEHAKQEKVIANAKIQQGLKI